MKMIFLCLQHALSDKACIQAFDPKVVMKQECLVTTFQNSYFYSPSFDDAKEKMRYVLLFSFLKSLRDVLQCWFCHYHIYHKYRKILSCVQKYNFYLAPKQSEYIVFLQL